MSNKEIQIKEYEAFDKIINIKLFNKIVSFIIDTTNVKDSTILEEIEEKSIWFKKEKENTIQEEYGFKYFGELLERYEQRIGTNIRDIRAIALSLGYSKMLVTNEMIMGTQLIDFINKIKRISEKDMYLKAALYLFDENKYYNLFEDVIQQQFNTTEDVIFAFSLFFDKKCGFEKLYEQLEKMIGNKKTIQVMENAGIYKWLIKTLYPIIKNNRKKGIEVLKILETIPICLVKEESNTYNVLLNNGYTTEEIAFLNYILVYYQAIPKAVRTGNSIVEEKIAINLCEQILNSENMYSEDIYELIETMLEKYRYFAIKVSGHKGIKEAIINSINIKNPNTFIKFYEIFDYKIQEFNILEKKWDIVSKEFSTEKYRHLFDEYLLSNDFSFEELKERISKYDGLSNSKYLDSFNIFEWNREEIFSKLVDKGVIELQSYFEKCKQNNITEENISLEHIKRYVWGIKTRKSFDFMKYLIISKNYSIEEIEELKFNLKGLFNKCYYSTGGTIEIERSFLSIDEHKELLMWLEEYIFNFEPKEYIDFVVAVLDSEITTKIFNKDELRRLYFLCVNINKKVECLRKKYLSEDELKRILKKEQEDEKRKEIEEKKKKENAIINEFKTMSKLTLEEIVEFINKYRWYREEKKMCNKIVKEYLEANIQNYEINNNEMIYFNEICNLLLKDNVINIKDIKIYLNKYILKGEIELCKE